MEEEKNINNTVENAPNADTVPLTQNELYDVLSFARTYYNTATSSEFATAFTPFLTNYRLSEIGTKTNNITQSELTNALRNPIENQKYLIGYSEFLELTEMISKRTMAYLGNLPTFDYTFTCTNIYDEKEYESEEYKKDLIILKDFLTKFDVKGQFSYVNRRTLKIDAYYGVFRTDGENYAFQELPYTNCIITGKSLDWGFLYDFDMTWFLKQGLSINQYPANFKKLWRRVFGGRNNLQDYDPSNSLTKRDGTFGLWTQTSPLPKDGNFVCFKFNSDIYATIPFLTPLFADTLNKNLLRTLQNNQYIIASQKVLVGLIPLLKEQKSGQIKDALAVAPETMGKFLGLLKQGLSESIKISGVPFDDIKDISFPLPDKNMYNDYNTTLAGNSGVTSRFIYATDKLSAAEVKFNSMIDTIISTQVYPQYSTWLSTMVNKLTSHYKFKFAFKGSQFDKQERLDEAEKLANRGIFVDQLYANAIGKNVFELHDLMSMSKHSSFYDLLRLPPNANTASMGSVGGRPNVDVVDAADSTLRNDDYEGGT